MDAIEAPIYQPEPGEHVRLLLHYDGWRAAFWFEVAIDGSIYLGPRYKPVSNARVGATAIEEGKVRVVYADGEPVVDPDSVKAAKVSFHSSGLVNLPGRRAFRGSLRELKQQELLCGILFQHPSMFQTIPESEIRDRDVCLKYPLDEASPLHAQTYIAPASSFQIVRNTTAHVQVNPIFIYEGLEGMRSLALQFVLSHTSQGPWPPRSCVFFPASEVGPSDSVPDRTTPPVTEGGR